MRDPVAVVAIREDNTYGGTCITLAARIGFARCALQIANHIYSLEVVITQNCLTTLSHFKDVLGVQSSIYVFSTKVGTRSPFYALTYRCTKAREVLELLQPFLVRKLREAVVGIEFAQRASFGRKGRRRHSDEEIALREDYYLRLRALKPRGPTAVVQ